MGASQTKAAALEPFTAWTRQAADDLTSRYKELDLPFGLTRDQLVKLMSGDEQKADAIFGMFAGKGKSMSALDLLCCVGLLANGSRQERLKSLYRAFDFQDNGKICQAELIILCICTIKAYDVVLTGSIADVDTAMKEKDAETAIESCIEKKFSADDENITLENFEEFVQETFSQLDATDGDFVGTGAHVIGCFGLELPKSEEAVAEEEKEAQPAAGDAAPTAEDTEATQEGEVVEAPPADEGADVSEAAPATENAEATETAPTTEEAEAAPAAEEAEAAPAAEEAEAAPAAEEAEAAPAAEEAEAAPAAEEAEAAPAAEEAAE